jgi:hypothetical protein
MTTSTPLRPAAPTVTASESPDIAPAANSFVGYSSSATRRGHTLRFNAARKASLHCAAVLREDCSVLAGPYKALATTIYPDRLLDRPDMPQKIAIARSCSSSPRPLGLLRQWVLSGSAEGFIYHDPPPVQAILGHRGRSLGPDSPSPAPPAASHSFLSLP